jgi:hypothetical protein
MQNDCLELKEYSELGARTFPSDFRMGHRHHSEGCYYHEYWKAESCKVVILLCKFCLKALDKFTSPNANMKTE